MKFFISLIFTLLACSSTGQIAVSYNYQGSIPYRSNTEVLKHPIQDLYVVATEKNSSGKSTTILTGITPEGKTQWYTSRPFFGTGTYFNGTGSFLTDDSFFYLSVFKFNTPAYGVLYVYKYDLNGDIVDSVLFDDGIGLKRLKSSMQFDMNGNLMTTVRNNSNQIVVVKIDPATLDVITDFNIGYSTYNNNNIERSMMVLNNGLNDIVAANSNDTLWIYNIDASNSLTSTTYLLHPWGDVVDIKFDGTNYILLTNFAYTNVLNPADNLLRIIKCDVNFSILSNQTYTPQKPLVYSSILKEADGSLYISAKNSNYSAAGGSIIKISSTGTYSEIEIEKSNFTHLILDGNYVVACGYHNDITVDCTGDGNHGNVFLRFKKSTSPVVITPSTHMDLTVNNITAGISYSSENFQNPATNIANYTVAGSGSTIYHNQLWVAGQEISSSIHSTSLIYFNAYVAGPITNPTDYDILERDKWNRVWIISKSQIDAHIDAYLTGNVSYSTPEVILNWPAHGDPGKGQVQNLARFKDLNNNGIYEPLLGEYPLILGDYCALSIYNDVNTDSLNLNCIDETNKMNIQVLEYAYGFNCDGDSSLQNTLFVRMEIINKSGIQYYNSYVGHHVDMDVGFANDDYISSDPIRGIFYSRNSDMSGPEQAYMILASAQDEDAVDNAVGIGNQESPNGFGYGDGTADNERKGMTSFVYFNNGVGPTGTPSTIVQSFNSMQGLWIDGSTIFYGGNGFMTGTTTVPTTFMFPGDSDNSLWYCTSGIDPGFDWSEEQAGNANGDRRGIASSGPFLIQIDDTVVFDVAYVTGMENTTAGYTSHEAMIKHVDSARIYFNINATPCGQNFDFYEPFSGTYPYLENEIHEVSQVVIYPNPTQGIFVVEGLPINSLISIYDISGKLILSQLTTDTNKNTVNVSELTSGIYLVNVTLPNGNYQTIKLVKQ